MRKLLVFGAIVMLVMVAAIVDSTRPVAAQVKQGKKRPLKTKQLMGGLVGAQCGALKKGLDASPSDDKAWSKLATNAALLNEASHILMADGRCPDATWAGAAKQLRSGSDAVLKAVAAKDVDAAKKAFGLMTKACGACHKAHKKK